MEANNPTDSEEGIEEEQQTYSPPHIVIGIESMQLYSIHITIDAKENTFARFGTKSIGNITTYSSLDEEDDEEEKKSVEKNKLEEEERK